MLRRQEGGRSDRRDLIVIFLLWVLFVISIMVGAAGWLVNIMGAIAITVTTYVGLRAWAATPNRAAKQAPSPSPWDRLWSLLAIWSGFVTVAINRSDDRATDVLTYLVGAVAVFGTASIVVRVRRDLRLARRPPSE